MLAELTIRESDLPISADANWRKPERIVLISSRAGSGINPEILAELESAADGAELVIVSDLKQAAGRIKDADVLLGNCTHADSSMKRLRWVQHFSAGVKSCIDNTDFLATRVLLTNMKAVYGPGIAEHVIAMMLSLSRGLHRFQRQQADGKWNRILASEYPMLELRGKTIRSD